MSPNYADRYNHPLWQKKRLEILQRAEFKCELCGESESQLHVHHYYYIAKRKPWQYDNRALVAVCGGCHEFEQGFACEDIEGKGFPYAFWEDKACSSIEHYRLFMQDKLPGGAQ